MKELRLLVRIMVDDKDDGEELRVNIEDFLGVYSTLVQVEVEEVKER